MVVLILGEIIYQAIDESSMGLAEGNIIISLFH